MIYGIDTIYGIDKKIRLIQRSLDSRLSDVWGNDVHIYGRVQNNSKNGKVIPEVYGGVDYMNPFVNDNQSATVAFVEKSKSITTGKFKSQIDIIFTVLLSSIHDNTLREDEKAIMQAYSALKKSGFVLDIKEVKRGIADVFAGYDTEGITYRDMQPWHVFSFECEIDYTENLC